MQANGKSRTPIEINRSDDRLPVVALMRALTEGGVGPSEMLECLYYAAEDDLLKTMRLVAALEPEQRLRVYEGLKAPRTSAQPI